MKEKINIETWERADVYNFFKDFLIPTYTITVEIDCTEAFKYCKQHKFSFFRLSSYAILRSINEIKELRCRIEDGGKTPVIFDVINLLTPIKVNDAGKFIETYVPYNEDFQFFYEDLGRRIAALDENTDSYAYMNNSDGSEGLATISCTPDLYFTSTNHACAGNKEFTSNLVRVGKVVERNDRLVMPMAICVHHGLSDGQHTSLLIKKTEHYLKTLIENI